MIVTKQKTEFPSSVDIPTLHYACKISLGSYGYVSVTEYPAWVDFEFSQDPGTDGLAALDSVIASHTGIPSPVPVMYEPISLVPKRYDVTSTSTYEEVAVIVSRIESIVSNLSTSFAYLLGGYSCSGGSPKIRIMCEPIGGTAFELLSGTPLADTSGAMEKLAVQTPTGSFPTGYALYTLEAKLDTASSLTLAGLTVTPMEL